MKLRLKNNSIRLRLTQTEVERIASNGSVEETITFGPLPHQSITYALETSMTDPDIHAAIDTNRIAVVVPESIAGSWAATDQVGMEAVQTTGGGDELQILIEKDFKCLEPRSGGDDADTFPHPLECSHA
jgi:hypothetical protein